MIDRKMNPRSGSLYVFDGINHILPILKYFFPLVSFSPLLVRRFGRVAIGSHDRALEVYLIRFLQRPIVVSTARCRFGAPLVGPTGGFKNDFRSPQNS